MTTVALPECVGDAAARAAIAQGLDRTLLVEAGAGTGKTTALVERIAALVERGTPPASIAAITFTEAAARELARRVAHRLRDAPGAATVEVDQLEVGTLHAFAQRILAEHTDAAGLPPTFEVLDDVAASSMFASHWSEFLDELLTAPRHARALRVLVACGVTTSDLETLAHALRRDWDRCRHARPRLEVPAFGLDAAGAAVDAACALAAHCTDPDDTLLLRCRAAARTIERVRAHDDDLEQLETLLDPRSVTSFGAGNRGRSASWPGGSKATVGALLADADAARAHAVDTVATAALAWVVSEIAAFVTALADHRRRAGRLEFHDLLVFARDLVRDNPEVQGRLHDRYQALLLDEFQDTDPIQMELAMLVATDAPDVTRVPWQELPVPPGRLFFVGDPKQSIYRFRRADIGAYLALRGRLGEELALTTNFRSSPSIVAWVNTVFSACMTGDDAQVGYQPLHADPVATDKLDAPVRVLGEAWPATTDLAELRAHEAAEIVATITEAVDTGWSVRDGGSVRPARPSDVAVLVPTRHALPAIETACAEAGLPTRIESEIELFATPEVEGLATILTAVAEPADDVAVVAALRSAAFACRDDELIEYVDAGGRWDFTQEPPVALDPAHAVVVAMRALDTLHRTTRWESVGEAVDRIVGERRMYELALGTPQPRVAWRRLAFVADAAYRGAGGDTLRAFARWLRAQAAAGARVLECAEPETDEEAVRILTAHGAKGLEFPIVILAGLGVQPPRFRPSVVVGPDGPEARVPGRGRDALVTAGYERAAELDAASGAAERIRLLYVAATRARDHLVVSLHHRGDQPCDAATIASALRCGP